VVKFLQGHVQNKYLVKNPNLKSFASNTCLPEWHRTRYSSSTVMCFIVLDFVLQVLDVVVAYSFL